MSRWQSSGSLQFSSIAMFILDSLLIGSLRFVLDKVVAGGRSRDAGRLGAPRTAPRGADAPRARRDHRRRVRRDRARRPRRASARSKAGSKARSPCRRTTGSPASTSRASSRRSYASLSLSPRRYQRLRLVFRLETQTRARSSSRGKGGVGKTTCAAALRRFAEGHRRARVLVVSTDPAHSLGDALGASAVVGAAPRSRGGLDAVELDARARVRAMAARSIGARSATSSSTAPGSIATTSRRCSTCRSRHRRARRPDGDRAAVARAADRTTSIVVDTAPTGHTLRLLAAPETVGAVAGVLDALQDEHRLIRDQLARVARPGGGRSADRAARRRRRGRRRSGCAIAAGRPSTG